MERTHDEETGKRINHLLCTRTSVQMVCLESDWPSSETFHSPSGDLGRTSGSSQRCWRGWRLWQRTSRRGSNQRKTTNKDTQQRHDEEMTLFWESRRIVQPLSQTSFNECEVQTSRMSCEREKCAHTCVQAGVLYTPSIAVTPVATGWARKLSLFF